MTRILLILIFISVQALINAQSLKETLIQTQQNCSLASQNLGLKSGKYVYDSKPDSMIRYFDSVKTKKLLVNQYEYKGDVVTNIYWGYDSKKKKPVKKNKYVHYLDKNLPTMEHEKFMPNTNRKYNDYSYKYLPSNGDTTQLVFDWDTLNETWINKYKAVNSINNQGINKSSTTFVWDTTMQDWIKNCVTTQELTKNSTEALKVMIKLPDTINYEHNIDYSFQRNTSNQLKIVKEIEGIDTRIDSLNYDNSGRLSSKYNNSSGLVFTYYNYQYDLYGRLIKIHSYYKEYENDQYEYLYFEEFYYSNVPTSVSKEINRKNIYVFPNPANEIISIEGCTGNIQIIDSSGRVVFNTILSEKYEINIAHLQQGIYYIISEGENPIKFIKK